MLAPVSRSFGTRWTIQSATRASPRAASMASVDEITSGASPSMVIGSATGIGFTFWFGLVRRPLVDATARDERERVRDQDPPR